MRVFYLFLFIIGFSGTAQCQDEFKVWTEVGVRGDVIKRLDWMLELNSRFGDGTVETFFPQVGMEYKVKKWLKPSVEYRFIVDKNKYGNYKPSHRLNFNVNYKENFDRIGVGVRLRYQYAFDRLGSNTSYDADFDQAFRIKTSGQYDIKKSIFTPVASAEFFYNPEFGPSGREFSKMRLAFGTKLELDGPHSASVKYQLDKRFHDYSAGLRHVLSLSYGYKL